MWKNAKGRDIMQTGNKYKYRDFKPKTSPNLSSHTLLSYQLPPKLKMLGHGPNNVKCKSSYLIDVTHKNKIGLLHWTVAPSLLCDRQIETNLKCKSYRTAPNQMMLYRTMLWNYETTHQLYEFIWQMCDKSRRHRIEKAHNHELAGAAQTEDK